MNGPPSWTLEAWFKPTANKIVKTNRDFFFFFFNVFIYFNTHISACRFWQTRGINSTRAQSTRMWPWWPGTRHRTPSTWPRSVATRAQKHWQWVWHTTTSTPLTSFFFFFSTSITSQKLKHSSQHLFSKEGKIVFCEYCICASFNSSLLLPCLPCSLSSPA